MNDTTSDFLRPLHHTLLIALIAAAGALLLAGLQGLRPEAYWWHVAVGKFTAHWSAVPDEQIFNYTVAPEQLWVHTEWLGTLILARLHELAGAELSLLVRNALLASTVAIVTWAVSRRHESLPAIAVPGAIATGLFVFFAGVEPAVLALPLAAFAVVCSFRLLDNPHQFWWALPLPLVILAVINLHFPTAIALIAVGLVICAEMVRRRRNSDHKSRTTAAAVIAASSLVCIFGFAYGPSYWSTAFYFAFHSPISPTSLVVLAIAAVATGCLPRHPNRTAVATILAATAIPALFAPTTIPLFGVAAALAIAPFFDAVDEDTSPFRPRKRHLAIAVVLLAAGVALQPGTITRAPVTTALNSELRIDPPLAGVMSADRPLRCAEELRRTGRFPRVFHEGADAGFLLYHLLDPETPHIPLFDDPRSLTTAEDLQRARNLLVYADDLTLLEDHSVDAVVIPREKYPALVEALKLHPDWYDLRPHDNGPYTCYLNTTARTQP